MIEPPIEYCDDLDDGIARFAARGYRLDMIFPADDPRRARMSRDGETIVLSTDLRRSGAKEEPSEDGTLNGWRVGRAGMEYRDLMPGRLGGRLIASHIRLTAGGEVPDYVHYHKVAFQLICCVAGAITVVYEDQGPPFVMRAGDVVLQPPEIPHRVLSADAGSEVVELGVPAEHETWVDHELELPNSTLNPERDFSGQRFCHHIAASNTWAASGANRVVRTDIYRATGGLADVQFVRLRAAATSTLPSADGEKVFIFCSEGAAEISTSGQTTAIKKGCAFICDHDTTAASIGGAADLIVITLSGELMS